MADRIKGITIEIDGQTTGLKKALGDITSQSISIQKELTDVNRLLKFDPGNTAALAQKQELLSKQIEITSQKLQGLKNAQSQVDEQFKSGKIGEDQYRAFQREIQFTEASLNKLKQSLSKVDDGSNIQKVKKDMDDLGKSTEEADDKAGQLKSGLSQLVVGAAAGVGIGKVIEEALDTSSLNTQIDISFNVPEESVQSVKNAISTVETYGVDSEAALEGVRRQWALNKDASDESNSAVVQGAATIVKAYSDIDFTELIQESNELSKTLGISDQDALALTYSLLKVGFPPDQIDIISEYGTQLKMAGYDAQDIQAIMAAGVDTGTWNIDNLLDGLKEGRIRMAQFGVSIDNTTAGLLKNTSISQEQLQAWGQQVAQGGEVGTQAMQEVAQALASVSDDTTRNALGVQLFGTMWEDQGNNITDTLLTMNDHLTTAEDNQNALNDATSNLNSDPMIQMKTAVSNLLTALTPLLTIIANAIGAIASFIAEHSQLSAVIAAVVVTLSIMIGVLAGIAPLITTLITAAGALSVSIGAVTLPILGIVAAITALVAAGVLLYSNWGLIKEKAAEVWTAISEGVSSFAQSIVNFFTATIPGALSSLGTFFSGLWTTIGQAFTDGWNSIVTFFTESIPTWIASIGEWFAQLPNSMAYGLGEAVGSVIKWGTDTYSYLTTNVPLWINSIGQWFSALPGNIMTWLTNVITNMQTWGSNMLTEATTAATNTYNAVISWFTQLPGGIETWLTNCVTNITSWGSNMLSEASSGMQSVFNGIVDTFANLPSRMAEIGTNIVAGIKQGISDAWNGMKGWIGGLCDSFIDGVKEKMDIHSPSRVMRALGVYTGEGFGLGIGDTVNSISKQANSIAAAAIPNVNAGSYDLGLNASGGGIGSGSNLDKILNKMDNMSNKLDVLEKAFNVTLQMDKTTVGKMITPVVSSNLAFNSGRKGW